MKKGIQSAKEILLKTNFLERILDQKKYIHQEFQDFGLRLAAKLEDQQHKSLYIKLAKETPRGFLEAAKNYVKDAYKVKSRGRLFMWRLKTLKEEAKKKK